MTALVWDKVGERTYQTGVDRGVLYLHDGIVAVWNGLTNVEESSDSELKVFYLDGVKYLETLLPGDFSGKLTAFTYPDEFDAVSGITTLSDPEGLSFYNQPAMSFNLSYRTKIGNDLEGPELGYKIHILYNVLAKPDTYSFDTANESGAQPVEFGWSLSGTPPVIKGYRPTVHISVDSLRTPPEVLKMLEDKLYGNAVSNASLPSLQEIAEYFGYVGALIIIDHGDGTWSAVDESDTFITMLDATTFQIDHADATYLQPTLYEISSTNVD
jgi:hypothetical protein